MPTPDPYSNKMFFLLLLLLFLFVLFSSSGVAVGAGWQSVVAYVNLGCYYAIGIPIGAVLGYIVGLQVIVRYTIPNLQSLRSPNFQFSYF